MGIRLHTEVTESDPCTLPTQLQDTPGALLLQGGPGLQAPRGPVQSGFGVWSGSPLGILEQGTPPLSGPAFSQVRGPGLSAERLECRPSAGAILQAPGHLS